MKALRLLTAVIAVLLLQAMFGSPARASDIDKLTIFTFSAPVELPGITLPAGTYVFKVLDTFSDRNVVQVFDKDRTHLYATFLTISDYRLQPSEKPIVRFSETAAGGPPAVKEWFYPGDTNGWAFVYPKSRAVELAKASKQAVPSMPSNLASEITKQANKSSDASVKAMGEAPLKTEQPNGSETTIDDSFSAKSPK